MTSNDRNNVLVPSFVVVIAAGLITTALVGLGAFIVDTREAVVRLETDVLHVQRDNAVTSGAVAGIPAQLATITEQMVQVRRELSAITASIDEKKRR